jgi:hypothetical protein
VINSILQIPVWQYVISMAILFACGSIVTYMIIRKPRVHSEYPAKRLSADVTPEFHEQVKFFCQTLGITMKQLIISAVSERIKEFMESTNSSEKISFFPLLNEEIKW